MRAEDQFHVGIVVDDLDAALDELAALFGYEWGPEVDVVQTVALPEGDASVRFHFRYSRNAPRIEVIQAQAGTLWTPAAGSGMHHLGYWSDDVHADGERLVAAGYAREADGTDDAGNPVWAYHRSPSGPRIELVNRALADLMAGLWT